VAGVGGPPTGVTDDDEAVAVETEIHHGNQFIKILRHGSWFFAASLLTKLAGLVLVPIYTDYLSPSQYGVLGTLDAVSRLLPLFISLYLDASFIRFYYTERRTSAEAVRRLYSTQFWFVAVWGSGVCVVGLALAPTLIQPLVDTPFIPYMPLVFAAPLFTQLGIMGSQVMRADLRAREVSIINMGSFVVTAAVSLTLLIGFGYGVSSLLWGLTVGPFFSFLVFTVIAVRRRLLVWTFDWSTLRRSLLFSIPLMPNLAGGWINGFSNRIILAGYGTLADVGLFTISAQLAYVMYFLTDAVTQVQDPIGMSALTEDSEAGKRQIAEFFSVFAWAVLAAFLAVTLFSKEVVTLITAPAYHSAYELVGVFAFAYVGGAVYRVFTVVLTYHRRLWVIGAGAVVSASMNIVVMFLLVPTYGQTAAAWSFLGSTLVYTLWIAWWSQRTDRVPLNWRVLRPAMLGAALVIAAYLVLDSFSPGELVEVPVKAALLASYVGMIFVVPAMAGLRAGVVNQARALRARLGR
jgi:O-antigen/teichoic acid export membrane protein